MSKKNGIIEKNFRTSFENMFILLFPNVCDGSTLEVSGQVAGYRAGVTNVFSFVPWLGSVTRPYRVMFL